MHQPIWVLRAGGDPTVDMAAEILRCEGYPWFEVLPAERFDTAPPEVRLLVIAGSGLSARAAEALVRSAAEGRALVALTPDAPLATALGTKVGAPVCDAHLQVVGLPDWEHGDLLLLCPGDVSEPLAGGEPIAELKDSEGHGYGAGVTEVRVGDGQAWLYGYDLCRTIATLHHGDGQLDPPDSKDGMWGGPRVIHSFLELSDKLPHDVPVADVHQDVLRSILRQALIGSRLPRLWHFPQGAPAVWMVRGDGCGEEGAEFEVDVVEKHGAFLTFCRAERSRYSGDLMREWHARGHGVTIEANINSITQQVVASSSAGGADRNRTAAEINAECLPAIRENLERHRDSFLRETGMDMEVFMTHSAQWTGLPMARMAEELGWHTLHPFQSLDNRIRPGDDRGPYLISTALPARYFDWEAGVLDLWYVPYQWIDRIWQTVAREQATGGDLSPEALQKLIGGTGEDYGAMLARFAGEAASRWHVTQTCSFHPCYVSKSWPYLGSSQGALEMGLDGAKAAGCRFENLERWSRFFRDRAEVRLTGWRTEGETAHLTLVSEGGIEGLTLLLPDEATDVRLGETSRRLTVDDVELEGRTQRSITMDLPAGRPVTLCLGEIR